MNTRLMALACMMLTMFVLVMGGTATAQADALGATVVQPRSAACDGVRTPYRNAQCATYLTAQWLNARGKGHVVTQTVAVNNMAGVWLDPETYRLCVFAEFDQLLQLGVHHCGNKTFFSYKTDGVILKSLNRTVAVLIHESFHGEEEEAGYMATGVTLTSDVKKVYRYEQGSDCAAGAGFRWLVSRGLRSEADFAEAYGFMQSLGASSDHGGGTERAAAFSRGSTAGVAACYALIAG
ncbi:MAG: hypothetical protein WAS27_03640 [Candidatus Saccharimonadales bacterium]